MSTTRRHIFATDPTNYVEHVHDGQTYRYALTPAGELARCGHEPYTMPLRLSWRHAEIMDHQTEPETDEFTGEVYPVDPQREHYVHALREMLEAVATPPRTATEWLTVPREQLAALVAYVHASEEADYVREGEPSGHIFEHVQALNTALQFYLEVAR